MLEIPTGLSPHIGEAIHCRRSATLSGLFRATPITLTLKGGRASTIVVPRGFRGLADELKDLIGLPRCQVRER